MRLPSRDLEETASLLNEEWEPFRGARILVTGATGFVGRWLVESFCRANDLYDLEGRIVALSRDPDSFLPDAPELAGDPGIAWFRGDLEDPRLFEDGALPGKCDFVVHAAGPSRRELADGGPETVARTVEGTQRLLDFAVREGARRFLYVSSGARYGRQPGSLARIPEEMEGSLDPRNPAFRYAEAKIQSESLCEQYAARYGLGAVVARGFAFIGPCLPLNDKFAAGSFLRDLLEGDSIRVLGDGTPIRSYLYAGDMSAWLWTILARGTAGRAYNVGSERAVSIAELARFTASLAEPPLPVQVAARADPAATPDRYIPSTERARAELGLKETVDWQEALRRTYEWLRRESIPEMATRTER